MLFERYDGMKNCHHSFFSTSVRLTWKKRWLIEAPAMIEIITYIEHSIQYEFLLIQAHGFAWSLYKYSALLRHPKINQQNSHRSITILENFPTAQEQLHGKNTASIYELRPCWHKLLHALAATTKLKQKVFFGCRRIHFDTAFPQDCQRHSVPYSLKMPSLPWIPSREGIYWRTTSMPLLIILDIWTLISNSSSDLELLLPVAIDFSAPLESASTTTLRWRSARAMAASLAV